MRKKLKPGDTFSRELGGITYDIKVMSVGEMLDAEDMLAAAKQAKAATAHYRAWLKIVEEFVPSWSHKRPVAEIRSVLDVDDLGDLLQAVMQGNKLEEGDAKN